MTSSSTAGRPSCTTRVKKNNSKFDVSMGSLDSAEVYELVRLYLLFKMEELIPREEVGIYRDDGLAITNLPGPELDRLRKKVVKLFQDQGLKITVETGSTITDFLDISLNLKNRSYRPFRKDAKPPVYINVHSNHPPHIKKQLPNMIS